ncbi:hypothetical protein AAMO2058_000470900 [Amorphochlora amoebiformis]
MDPFSIIMEEQTGNTFVTLPIITLVLTRGVHFSKKYMRLRGRSSFGTEPPLELKFMPRDLWIADQLRPYCCRCRKEFHRITKWRHHCRLCGEVFCDTCCKSRVTLSDSAPGRVCQDCYELIVILNTSGAIRAEVQTCFFTCKGGLKKASLVSPRPRLISVRSPSKL